MFIYKRRMAPLMLASLDAAIGRLPNTHEMMPILSARLAAVQAGFGGEQELDKVFDRYSFSMKHGVFHDMSLMSSTYFQVDTLLVTPWFAVLFEVKNISGELIVTANPPQLIRKSDSGQVTGFQSPLAQLESNCELFQDWLSSRGVSIPVYGAVVLAYAKQRIDVFDTVVPILFPHSVPTFIRKLPTESPLLEEKTFSKLLVDLKKSHRSFRPSPISEMYKIPKHDFRTGVICPECGVLGMEKYMGGWRCLACGVTSRTAHEQAIRDWFHLFGGEMTNKDCREFLHVDRQQTAHRLLASMELEARGTKRGRTYRIKI
ncbi:NERD domain-containing protein [Sporosarcina sp. Sa2YVA2]|uniref:NERD domain-containing protein n=1 Tax=Sporosarcina quadrami TaxID=2762234 RepID=A0ABR8UCV7_9BACL|nr:nuclease-related domain-containing protein [Sporosarcina quadrami]MBD7985379.1 NERD domain-containing protein [Sporosarcina quadrami]